MKEIAFVAVAGFVSMVLSRFLPPTPGLENMITLIGTLAAIAGGAIGTLFKSLKMWPLVGLILVSLAFSLLGLTQFNSVASGEPGSEAANWLYVWTAMLFLPIGVLIEVAGLKVSERPPTDSAP
jgi:hypothetical protein